MREGLSLKTRGRSLRSRLALWLALALLPLALLGAAGVAMLAQQQHQQSTETSRQLARAVAQAVDAEMQRVQAALQVLAHATPLPAGDLRGFHEQARRVVAEQRGWLLVNLTDAEGRPLLHTNYAPGSTLPPVADRDSLQRVLLTRQPEVGNLSRGYRGQLAMPVRVPVMQGGELRYVLTAVLQPQVIAQVLQRQGAPSDWVLTVFDRQGLRIARSRGAERLIGTPPTSELMQLMQKGAEPSGWATLPEGDRLHMVVVQSASGWRVAVGLPAEAVYAGTQTLAWALALGLLGSLVLAMAVAVGASRDLQQPVGALRRAAVALGEGRRPELPQQRIAEFSDVFDALGQAAEQQAVHAAERARLMAEADEARRQAEAANRAKDEFLAMLGHELRNPLAPITTALRLMAMRDPGALQSERRVLERQVAHLTRLVDDLLDVSRFARGKVQLKREPLDIREVVARAVEITQPLLDQRERPVKMELPPWPVYVSGDGVRLAQVFSNLLSNAAKFTPSEGRVSLRVQALEAVVEISVEDSGAGMPPDLVPRVFDLFVQGRQSVDRQFGGLGLGLAIVKTLVELHGGSVRAHSDGEGMGSRFIVTLPRVTAATASTADTQAPSSAAPTGRSLLLVDDHADGLETMAQWLRGQGHAVATASNAAQALAMLEDLRPDVALLDIGLPGMDGLELARRLRADARWRPMRLIALTGYGREADRVQTQAAGFDEHLVKPVAPEQLQAAIDRLLAGSGQTA